MTRENFPNLKTLELPYHGVIGSFYKYLNLNESFHGLELRMVPFFFVSENTMACIQNSFYNNYYDNSLNVKRILQIRPTQICFINNKMDSSYYTSPTKCFGFETADAIRIQNLYEYFSNVKIFNMPWVGLTNNVLDYLTSKFCFVRILTSSK